MESVDLVWVESHVPERVGHVVLAYEYALVWEFNSQAAKLREKVGGHLCTHALTYAV